MIEKIVFDYLTTEFGSSTPVFMEKPQNPPRKFVVIEKTGSSRFNKLESATMAIQSYGASLYEAASLNEDVKRKMYDLPSVKEVYRCELNSDYNYTDTTTKNYRYQAVFDITHY